MIWSYFEHLRACRIKQQERRDRIASLPPEFHNPLSARDKEILDLPVSELALRVRRGEIDPEASLIAYSKTALKAHEETNCLTEVMIHEARGWAKDCNKNGPLAGVPVSLKDMLGVKGFDSSVGFSAWVGRPMQEDSIVTKLLRDAGAIPFVKTNIPITLMSFESNSDLFGLTTNPHHSGYAPGGSTGGEAALLAYGGSRIGIGTDVAGSVRVPAHFSGIYAIRSSVGRFPRSGSVTSIPGQEGVPSTHSPMTRTLEDLETVWRAVIEMKPWEYDYNCLVLPWREVDLSQRPLKWGVMWEDGVIAPSPACKRALQLVVDQLQKNGHEIVSIDPPSAYEGTKIASQLLLSDEAKLMTKPIRLWEWCDAGIRQVRKWFNTPWFLKKVYIWYIRYIRKDQIHAGFLEGLMSERKITDYWPLVARREAYRKQWFDMWNAHELDFVLTVPNALPAVPHGGTKDGVKSCGYTVLFNMLDYTAGVLPITHVDAALDRLPQSFKPRNTIERGVYRMYDAEKMAGLPVGVQIVGRRLEEERVLEAMKVVQNVMRADGMQYELLKKW
ncbi:amidase protein [Moniliophthora roreri MCA 2997]|uniref:amidase n=1 Tax=Moniliophthora roreri (strain MCA 2997) TaxID=1381753 RepID=V2X2R4_MONRO|nr:amidase protein [Moniliophthora roreri MCA 2997]